MGPMGGIADPSHLVGVLSSALRQVNAKGVLLTGWLFGCTAAHSLMKLLLTYKFCEKLAPRGSASH